MGSVSKDQIQSRKADIQVRIDAEKRNLESLKRRIEEEQTKIKNMTSNSVNNIAKKNCRERIKMFREQMEPIKRRIKQLQEQKKNVGK